MKTQEKQRQILEEVNIQFGMIRYSVRPTSTPYLFFKKKVNLPVPPRYRTVIVQVFDEDSKREELISEGEVDLTKVLEDGEMDGRVFEQEECMCVY